jgi:hypothetical protein
MKKTRVYSRKKALDVRRKATARSSRAVSAVAQDSSRPELKPRVSGPVAIWDGTPKRSSIEHDVCDECEHAKRNTNS